MRIYRAHLMKFRPQRPRRRVRNGGCKIRQSCAPSKSSDCQEEPRQKRPRPSCKGESDSPLKGRALAFMDVGDEMETTLINCCIRHGQVSPMQVQCFDSNHTITQPHHCLESFERRRTARPQNTWYHHLANRRQTPRASHRQVCRAGALRSFATL